MSPEIRELLQDVAAGEIGPAIAGRAAAALVRHNDAPPRVTMAEIDAARARADEAIAARRAYQNEPRPRPFHRGETLRRQHAIASDVEVAEQEVLELLARWWAQGCRP